MSADRVNVVIVGGGIIGCCTAYFLARAGAHVTLLERGPLCGEASSANAGLVGVANREGIMYPLALESRRMLVEVSRELEADVELAQSGSVALVRTEEDAHRQRAFVARQREKGVQIEYLDRQTVLDMEPAASPDCLGGVYGPIDSTVCPYRLTIAFAQAARRLGAAVRTGVEVTALATEGGRVRAASTRDGEVAGDVVVVAAGAWSPMLTRTVGLDLPIEPSRGQIMITEPAPPPTRRTVKDLGHIYVRPTARGNYLIGSMTEKVGFNKQLTTGKLREYLSEAAGLVPALGGVRVLRAWAGLRPLTPDNMPIVGPVEGYEGLMIAAGHGRTGVCLSCVTSKMVADLITTGSAAFPLDAVGAARFKPAA